MERRRTFRHQRPFVAFCRTNPGALFERTAALDLSAGGARIESERPLAFGQTVTLNLRCENSRLVSFQARVQWVAPSPNNRTYQVGLSWASGSRADVCWLQSWLHRHDMIAS